MSTTCTDAPVTQGSDLLLPSLVDCLDLDQTLDCGQAFRWVRDTDGSYRGVVSGKLLHISTVGSDILLHDTTRNDYELLWRDYFDLDRDYRALKQGLAVDPVMGEAIGYAPGIRVLHQPAWEALCTFIISANNNIARIKGIVERMCQLLGDPIADGYYSFPAPERLAALCEQELAPLRCGYRSSYLLDAATKVASGTVDLAAVATMPLADARATLLTIKGVGPKVADCALLFGFGRVECFPLDTWMKKVMATLYPQGLPDLLLPTAGLAQQYLFHYARHHGELFT